MNVYKRAIAATELALLSPAALFMTALLGRDLFSSQAEPARIAQQIVGWYANQIWTLWVLLVSLPLAVLVLGAVTLWRSRAGASNAWPAAPAPALATRLSLATLIIAATTVAAVVILAVVGLHILAN